MADLFCSSLHFRSLATNYTLPFFLPSNRYYSSPLHSHNSVSRKNKRPLHLTLFSLPSSSEIDVISTHEHSDGSLVFRFGDPTEVAKNVEMEGESKDASGVMNVVEGDNETEKADTEVTVSSLTEVADYTNSVVSSSKAVIVVESESESREKLLEGSTDLDLPVLTSSEETRCIFIPVVVDIGHIEKETADVTSTVKEMKGTSVVDVEQNGEMVNNISPVALSEEETGDFTSTDVDIGKTGSEEEDVDEEHAGLSTENACDKSPEVVNNSTILDSLDKETDGVTSITDKNTSVLENGVHQASLETDVTRDVLPIFEHENVETEMQKEATEDDGESFDSNVVSQIEEENLQAEMEKVAIGKSIESDMNNVKANSPPMEAVDYETSMEESREDDGSENLKVVGDIVEAPEHEATTATESSPIRQGMSTRSFVLSSGAALLPHPSKVLTGGEDAYFIAGQTWLGIADGVGQWSLEGTNPGVYAQELMKNCERLISIDNGNSICNPLGLLNLSVAETYSPGSSTVLIAQFDGQALHMANIGDSGFIILRDGVVYKRSSPMHHAFHFPIQIERGDDPSSLAELYIVDLKEEDVIITATDGLLDNLYDQEISSMVMKSLPAGMKLEEIAELLAMMAREIGSSESVRTPFADDAQAAGFGGFSGGKLDDVAVIVSIVQRR